MYRKTFFDVSQFAFFSMKIARCSRRPPPALISNFKRRPFSRIFFFFSLDSRVVFKIFSNSVLDSVFSSYSITVSADRPSPILHRIIDISTRVDRVANRTKKKNRLIRKKITIVEIIHRALTGILCSERAHVVYLKRDPIAWKTT